MLETSKASERSGGLGFEKASGQNIRRVEGQKDQGGKNFVKVSLKRPTPLD